MELAEQVINLLLEKNLTLSVAESCTGGTLAGELTSVSGASSVFLGGVVSYTNNVKNRVLSVPKEILDEFGAVSSPCALAMADGVRKLCKTDFSLSVTGVAGPNTSEGKPVGLVYIGMYTPSTSTFIECHFTGSRDEIRKQAVSKSLNMLLDVLK